MTRKEAQARNWNIFMFRGMAYRVCWITKALFESGLTKDEIKTVVKFNTIMNNKIKLLDDKIKNKPKKHKKHKCEEDLFSENKCHICGKQMIF